MLVRRPVAEFKTADDQRFDSRPARKAMFD
jgi:hypothetical protein